MPIGYVEIDSLKNEQPSPEYIQSEETASISEQLDSSDGPEASPVYCDKDKKALHYPPAYIKNKDLVSFSYQIASGMVSQDRGILIVGIISYMCLISHYRCTLQVLASFIVTWHVGIFLWAFKSFLKYLILVCQG